MRRLFTVALGMLCAASIMGCSAKADNAESQATTVSQESTITKEAEEISETNESAPITGGWAINNNFKAIDNVNAMSAFEKATEDLVGYRYDVAAVLGSQIVAGTNYLYLCRAEMAVPDAKPEYVIIKVYEDLEGNAEVTGSLRLLEGKEGWEYNDANPYMEENEEVKAAFDKALEGLTGVEHKPIAYIGHKDNSYAVLTKITIVSVEPMTSLSVVYINATESGVMIDNIDDIDLDLEAVSNN